MKSLERWLESRLEYFGHDPVCAKIWEFETPKRGTKYVLAVGYQRPTGTWVETKRTHYRPLRLLKSVKRVVWHATHYEEPEVYF